MAVDLKRIQLLLDPELTVRLRDEARRLHLSVSELAGSLLGRSLGLPPADGEGQLARIRRLRSSLPPMADSTPTIRRSRDDGW